MSHRNRVRPLVQGLSAYVPGEQPRVKGLIKLNTNENPYPPSPKVLAAVRAAVDDRLRLYPQPNADSLRVRLAQLHGCGPENIFVGNGSDEFLALATRAFVEPAASCAAREPHRAVVQYFSPSYSLYPVLADIHGATRNPVRLAEGFGLPSIATLRRERVWDRRAALTFVTTPNAPTGRGFSTVELNRLCTATEGVVVLDEAYADFAAGNAMELALQHPHVLVARTFSKAYSLCALRVGYGVGHPSLIEAILKVKDSYNVNGLGLVAAAAVLADLGYFRANIRRVIATRDQLARDLAALGFGVSPSQTNFLLVRPPRFPAPDWLAWLRENRILVRWFADPEVREWLRITIGTPEDSQMLVKAVRRILAH